ncbi:MAG: cytochrome C, partial [Woeseiaceae bacterium]|nr:cytochrome C [Woeseiaceae bacterium]
MTAAVLAAAVLVSGPAESADEETLARGAYLLHAGGCISCHTSGEPGDDALAGGHALESPFGVFYSPNITPDAETGIGSWSDE